MEGRVVDLWRCTHRALTVLVGTELVRHTVVAQLEAHPCFAEAQKLEVEGAVAEESELVGQVLVVRILVGGDIAE